MPRGPEPGSSKLSGGCERVWSAGGERGALVEAEVHLSPYACALVCAACAEISGPARAAHARVYADMPVCAMLLLLLWVQHDETVVSKAGRLCLWAPKTGTRRGNGAASARCMVLARISWRYLLAR